MILNFLKEMLGNLVGMIDRLHGVSVSPVSFYLVSIALLCPFWLSPDLEGHWSLSLNPRI